jgi:hypothetical protein
MLIVVFAAAGGRKASRSLQLAKWIYVLMLPLTRFLGYEALERKVPHAADSQITAETTNRNSLNLSRNSADGL